MREGSKTEDKLKTNKTRQDKDMMTMPRQAQSTTQPLARRSSEIGGKRFLEMQANVYSDKSP
jgi:hypothetical protein